MRQQRAFDYYPVTTYSNLMEWLELLSMRSASAAQWIATINAAKGIREEEIERSELLNFLFEQDDAHKVMKEQLLEIAEYALSTCEITIQTERVTLYRPALQSASFTREQIPQKVLDTFEDNEIVSCHKLTSFDYKVVRLKFTGMFGSGESWFVFDEHWRQFKPKKSYGNAVDAVDFLYTVATDKFSKYSSQAPRNLYERYALLGKNEGYKEWIVSVPNWPAVFEQSHFDVENTILHLRTSVWKDTDDQPLLLIDEIQSDWHALGREKGYISINDLLDKDESDAVSEAPFMKEWHELGIKLAIWIALQSGHHRIAFTTGNVHKSRYGRDLEGFHLLYDQLIPKSLAKLASKFKCHLGSATITISKPNDTIRYRSGAGWELRHHGQNDNIKIVKNEVVAMHYLESRGLKRKEEVRVFEISPVLAGIVKNKGLPLFGWW